MPEEGFNDSIERETLALFKGLRDRDYRCQGLFAIEGRIVFEKALAAGTAIRGVLCVRASAPDWESVCRDRGIPFHALSVASISELAGYPFHRGILALAERPRESHPADACVPPGDILALWQVSDPDNIGVLIRSAAALGASAVCMGPGCADPFGRKALRASMGNALSRPLFFLNGMEDLAALRGDGRRLIAAALVPDARPFEACGHEGTTALVLGNEGYGLPVEIVRICDEAVLVPMPSDVDSLNVGAAGAILMYGLFGGRHRAI